jgi:hypothetical protein
MVLVNRAAAVLAAAALVSGCKPTLDDTSPLVTAPRVLAVQSSPAEVTPGNDVTYTTLFVDATGKASAAPLSWALCTLRKPLTELGPVSPDCLVEQADWLVPLGDGTTTQGTIPKDACRNFGPDTPDTKAGEPPGRPVDPDLTGGYYQPLRVKVGAGDVVAYAAAETRLTCGVAGASQDQVVELKKRRRPNTNPALAGVSVSGGAPLGDLGAFDVAPGARVSLSARWPACPTAAVCGDGVCSPDEDDKACPDDCKDQKGCAGAEIYAFFDPTTHVNETATEAMRVSWFSTAGSFDASHTGPVDTQTPASANVFVAPAGPGDVTLWVVLRDDRGGVGWTTVIAHVH